MREISVVLYTALVDVYVHRMKTVVLETSRPGSACAKRISIRISSSVFSSASAAHTTLYLVDHTAINKETHSPILLQLGLQKSELFIVFYSLLSIKDEFHVSTHFQNCESRSHSGQVYSVPTHPTVLDPVGHITMS
jgi:hypothetical protein